jgi:heptosyltransferase-2
MMKILLVQSAFLGDVVLATPLIRAIHYKHPNCELSFLTTPAAAKLLKCDQLLKEVIVFDKRKEYSGLTGIIKFAKELRARDFDLVYTVHKSARTSILLYLAGIRERIGFKNARLSFLYSKKVIRNQNQHDVLRNLDLLQLGEEEKEDFAELRLIEPRLENLNEKFVAKYEDLIKSIPYAVITPGSMWETKRWHAEGFRAVAEYLRSIGLRVFLLGAPNESKIAQKVAEGLDLDNLVGQTSMEELLFLAKNAQLIVCNDSMMLHVASAFKRPNVSIFCATSPEFGFGPWRNHALTVEKQGLACKPCMRHGSKKCPNGTNACMNDLGSDKVIRAIEKIME